MLRVFKIFLLTFFRNKSSLRFAIGVVLGMGFSISVILSTVGIMDGFVQAFKKKLKYSVGDISIVQRDGLFYTKGDFLKKIKNLGIDNYSILFRTNGFAIFNEVAKGIEIFGINPKTYSKVTSIKFTIKKDEIAVGSELARTLNLKIGDFLVIAFANGNKEFNTLPSLKRFKVSQIINHGIYLKDARIIYVNLSKVQKTILMSGKANVLSLNVPTSKYLSKNFSTYFEKVEYFSQKLKDEFGIDYSIRPYWREYKGVFDAVEVEKFMVSLILQVIVVIAIFNAIGFIVFLNERHIKEIFLFRAIGMNKNQLSLIWFFLMGIVWIISCLVSLFFVQFMNWMLQNIDFFKLPGDIYHLSRLEIILGSSDYAIVFISALFWLLLISFIAVFRIRKKSILLGLRKEFV